MKTASWREIPGTTPHITDIVTKGYHDHCDQSSHRTYVRRNTNVTAHTITYVEESSMMDTTPTSDDNFKCVYRQMSLRTYTDNIQTTDSHTCA